MSNRILEYSAYVQTKLDKLDASKVKDLDRQMAINFNEHYTFQDEQAQAHAMGKLSLEEAQVVYNALGEGFSNSNGGWTKGTSTALKVTITKLIGELIGVRA